MLHPLYRLWIRVVHSVSKNVIKETTLQHSNQLRSKLNLYNQFIGGVAWQAVSQDTISICFDHARLLKKQVSETEPAAEVSKKLNTETEDFSYLMQAL